MLYLAFVWHMHQPYYSNVITGETLLPWVRLHGIKDYLDMVTILEQYPAVHQTFNVVPSLLEQITAYVEGKTQDTFYLLSQKPIEALSNDEKRFIVENFFMADPQKILALHPRYFDLYLKAKDRRGFSDQDIIDLQVWFNLAWFDPDFRTSIPSLQALVRKARFFNQQDKFAVLESQIGILSKIIPTYKAFQDKGQIELSVTPYYHPILPLLYNTKIAKRANKITKLPNCIFEHPEDCRWHIQEAIKFYQATFGRPPAGMWPSEQAISKEIIPLLMESGIQWFVSDESIVLKTLRRRKIDRANALYQSHYFDDKNKRLHAVFRDKNLADLIGFVYQYWDADKAVDDFMAHLNSIHAYFKGKDCLVTVALDGENCWEYYKNDGKDFLHLLYQKISESKFLKSVTVGEYITAELPRNKLRTIAAGSWINGDLLKWIGNPAKNRAWELLCEARKALSAIKNPSDIALKQMHVLEGSDWFWWYGDKQRQFDELFRMHLKNFYAIIKQTSPTNLDLPLE